MFSQWSLSERKSPQASRALLSILADLNNVIIWMVTTCPLISESSRPPTNSFVTVPSAPITDITITFMFRSIFSFLRDLGTYLNFHFQFKSVVSRNGKVHYSTGSLFFLDYYDVLQSDGDQGIRLYLKVLQTFARLIFQDINVVHIPFVPCGQISISFTITCRIQSYTLFVLT